MGAKSYIGAETKEKSRPMEVQDVNLELYYQLFFVPSMASISTNDDSTGYIGDLFSSRYVYFNPLCGIDKGVVADSIQMFADCSCVEEDLVLDLKKVDPIIRQIEDSLDRTLSCYLNQASLVTLHLAIHSETQTEDIAKCFAYGIDANHIFHPEDENLKNQIVSNGQYKVLHNAKNCGFNIQLDYFNTFDTRPVLVTKELIDESTSLYSNSEKETDNEKIVPILELMENNTGDSSSSDKTICPITKSGALVGGVLQEESILGNNHKPETESVAVMDSVLKEEIILDNNPWPKTAEGAFMVSAVKYDFEEENWSWKQTSDVAHPVLDSLSSVSGWLSLGFTAVAVTAGIVGLVVSAPVVATIASVALLGATISGGISTTASVADGVVYYIDHNEAKKDGDDEKSKESLDKANDILLWEGVSFGINKGAAHGARHIFKKFKIQPFKEFMEANEASHRQLIKERAAINSKKQRAVRRNNNRKDKKRLKSINSKSLHNSEKKLLKDQNRIDIDNERIKNINKEIRKKEKLKNMPSEIVGDSVSSTVSTGHQMYSNQKD